MDWLSVLAVVAFIIGIAGGGVLVARSPSFWIAFGTQLFRKVLPVVIAFVLKRKSPEEEKKWRDEYAKGLRDRSSD